jgi:two-component system, NtrC family, response regulator HydG
MRSHGDATILIVDDEEETAALLRDLLERRRYRAVAVSSGSECLEYLRSGIADVVITDVQMPGMSGLDLCRELHVRHPDLLAIVLTGVADLENAIGAIRSGAYDFITKPVKTDVLEIAIKRALDHLAVRREVTRLRLDPAIAVNGIIGTSPAIRAMIELTRRAATSAATVLVTGESGTGKELVARALHQSSSRANAPFVALNCGAVPAPLLESELFGHVRGAFTDAKHSRAGLFVQAGAGTLFLDEISEMPLDVQAKLLRALQERKLRPVGADDEHPFACRIVAATNRDLEQEVAGKRFREDLFYRIDVVVIPVPPLRERGEDVIELARLFLARAIERSRRAPLDLSPSVAQRLTEYDWPGNVRELENSIERAVAIARGPMLEVADLPVKIAKFAPTNVVIATDTPEEMVTLAELQRSYVRSVLAAARGNKSHAAKLLGIDRRSLYRRLEESDDGPAGPLEKASG